MWLAFPQISCSGCQHAFFQSLLISPPQNFQLSVIPPKSVLSPLPGGGLSHSPHVRETISYMPCDTASVLSRLLSLSVTPHHSPHTPAILSLHKHFWRACKALLKNEEAWHIQRLCPQAWGLQSCLQNVHGSFFLNFRRSMECSQGVRVISRTKTTQGGCYHICSVIGCALHWNSIHFWLTELCPWLKTQRAHLRFCQ